MNAIEAIVEFFATARVGKANDVWHSKTRDELQARLSSWLDYFFIRLGATEESAVMLSAVLGELGNNAFDHNLGQWKDEIGCIIGFLDLGSMLRAAVADRGQGIIASLENSLSTKVSSDEVVRIAFEERISGRAPERRGNGLKFVGKQFKSSFGDGLLCLSEGGLYKIGESFSDIGKKAMRGHGTFIVLDWRKS